MLLYAPPFWNASIFTKLIVLRARHALIAVYLVCVTEMLLPLPCWLPKQLIFIVFVTKTIKPIINEAFVAFSEDVITDYNDSYGRFTHCAAPCKHNTMSAFVIVETPNKHYSTLLKTRVWIVSSQFFKYWNVNSQKHQTVLAML